MVELICLVIRDETNRAADDANTEADTEMVIKNEIKTESTTDNYAFDDNDVGDSKDRLQKLITPTNIKSE